MDIQATLKAVVKAAEDKLAQDIVVLNLQGIALFADYFVICHGNSEIQVQAIAKEIKEKAEELGIQAKMSEGYEQARWVLIDLGDIVVHVFHKEEREYYNLEKLWVDAARVEVGGH